MFLKLTWKLMNIFGVWQMTSTTTTPVSSPVIALSLLQKLFLYYMYIHKKHVFSNPPWIKWCINPFRRFLFEWNIMWYCLLFYLHRNIEMALVFLNKKEETANSTFDEQQNKRNYNLMRITREFFRDFSHILLQQ